MVYCACTDRVIVYDISLWCSLGPKFKTSVICSLSYYGWCSVSATSNSLNYWLLFHTRTHLKIGQQCLYISKYKKVGVLPMRIVWSNVSSIGPSSERNPAYAAHYVYFTVFVYRFFKVRWIRVSERYTF